MARGAAYYRRHREAILVRHAHRRITRHKPDGVTPRALLLKVRLRCLALGFDPGSTPAMQLAAIEIYLEAVPYSAEWCWLHPDEIHNRSIAWAQKRRNLPRLRQRVTEAFNALAPDRQSPLAG